jgi:hypothetical protein
MQWRPGITLTKMELQVLACHGKSTPLKRMTKGDFIIIIRESKHWGKLISVRNLRLG